MTRCNEDTTKALAIAPRSAQEVARSILEPVRQMKVDVFVDYMILEGFTSEEAIHALQILVLQRRAHVDDLRALWMERDEPTIEVGANVDDLTRKIARVAHRAVHPPAADDTSGWDAISPKWQTTIAILVVVVPWVMLLVFLCWWLGGGK